eukprot:g12649.t1
MSNVIPVGQRHDRVILGFTADGEHVVCCCGPVANPSRLELRRVGLQWPGLSRPGEALWSLPLKVRGRGDGDTLHQDEGSESNADDGDIEGDEEEEDDEHGLGVDGVDGQEPASVTMTESADGFLVVAVVSLRYPSSELQEDEEDRVYRVFVAPGPSYAVAVRDACVEQPFVGTAFSYIVPTGGGQGGGGTPVPSIAAHDVGAVGAAGGGGGGGRGLEERVYVIVVNAVDAIRAVEVRLHADYARAPLSSRAHASTTGEGIPLPPRTKFTLRPLEPPDPPGYGTGGGGGLGGGGFKANSSISDEREGGVGGGAGGNVASREGGGGPGGCGVGIGDGSSSGSGRVGGGGGVGSSIDPSSVWWACGRDLLSSPLVGTRPLPCRRRAADGGEAAAVSATGGAEPREAARGDGGAAMAEPALPSSSSAVANSVEGEGGGVVEGYDSSSSSSSSSEGVAEDKGGGGGSAGTGTGTGGMQEGPPAAAPPPPPVPTPAAQSRRWRRGKRRRAYATADRSRQRVLDLEVFISQLLLRREAFPELSEARQPPLPTPAPTTTTTTASRKRKSSGRGCGGPGGGSSQGAPPVLATDYHCVTVGLMNGGRRVLLCLVVEVVSTGKNRGGRAGDGGAVEDRGGAPREKDGGGAHGAGTGVLGFVLALDLECGEVAVLETRSGRGSGKRCAVLCESLARSVRRGGACVVDRPGRRLSNTNVIQGRSLGAIVNPVYPVAIVMGSDGP